MSTTRWPSCWSASPSTGSVEHQAAFQAIADANGGTRAAGTPGYEHSVEYVVDRLTAAGYNVTLDAFPFIYRRRATLRQTAPLAATYETGAFTGTGNGSVTAAVTAVDINLVPPRGAARSGCEAADFAGFPAGNIALVQRGTCAFAVKALNAQAAGASAVIIFNQGNTPDRERADRRHAGSLEPRRSRSSARRSPTAWRWPSPARPRTVESPPPQSRPAGQRHRRDLDGNPNNVVMVGAHLDSVQAGPGINDNGSG